MPARTAAEKAERKLLLQQKREARQEAKAKKEAQKQQQQQQQQGDNNQSTNQESKKASANTNQSTSDTSEQLCWITELPQDALYDLFTCLTARDLGCLTLTCRHFNTMLVNGRIPIIMSRLHCPKRFIPGAVGYTNMCADTTEARSIIEASYGGGDTGRIIPKGKRNKGYVTEFVSYLRYLEEVACGYATQNFGGKTPALLPPFVQGRFVSVSPEHSLVRVGGDGIKSGAGGSGVASWGVGKRGQLGHGRREDMAEPPRMLLGGIGYGIRIVQVSAGGGLVRVAHSLLLTSTGRVLSFGTGQYGALGHGYSAGKQLPDVLRPQYIEALNGIRCVCVSAGELHSAAVTSDGDLYTWGDGFCGQLGHGDKRPQTVPIQVEKGGLEDECVANVSCGSRHTIAVTEEGEVFTWGLGHFGVLGRSFTPYDHDADAAVVALGGNIDGPPQPPAVAAAADEANDNNNNDNAQRVAAAPAAQDETEGNNNQINFAEDLMRHLDMIANLTLVDSSDQCIPKIIDSLNGIKIVGASAGHRHSLLIEQHGGLYSCGAGITGCLGHGDYESHMVPVRIKEFDDIGVQIMQMSAGVDMSMAVSTTGNVYAWGKTDMGRIGLGLESTRVTIPKKVQFNNNNKAVDVDCGYVHSIITALDGTIHVCGKVGINGDLDGGYAEGIGYPRQVQDFNIWHCIPEPKMAAQKQERWKKYGKYEVKGKRKMMEETFEHALK